jgi:hypothetical protein
MLTGPGSVRWRECVTEACSRMLEAWRAKSLEFYRDSAASGAQQFRSGFQPVVIPEPVCVAQRHPASHHACSLGSGF